MPAIPPQQQAIEHIVGADRARFDRRERRVYSHDTGVLPRLFQLLAGPSLDDGVVQPENEDQLIGLVRFAAAQCIPLVPRGKAISGYRGAVPARGGLVVDLTHLRDILAIMMTSTCGRVVGRERRRSVDDPWLHGQRFTWFGTLADPR